MFKHILRIAKNAIRDKLIHSDRRSGHWATVRKHYLVDHNECAACGGKTKLNVHHVRPFHLHPDLELDPTNFITLCMALECHFIVGHGGDYRAYNPDVREDAQKIRESVDIKSSLKLIEPIIHAKKLFE